ncbi:unnamed protein product [Strongylus vulgaris]|uniref:Uncharacterized protein n=1 Tax=Strongylus vulgaris TaxID=40348 RepID=A0A3P7IVD6_STRVU|nr:unnamed protein product [Strongylus vulgaris]
MAGGLANVISTTGFVTGTIAMLRPGEVKSFNGYSAMNVDSLLCAVSQGYCGANVPLYLLYSDAIHDYYIGLQPATFSTYSAQYSGKPLCYVWEDSSSTTTVTTTFTSAVLGISTTTSSILDSTTTSSSIFDNNTTITTPFLNNDSTTSNSSTSITNTSSVSSTSTLYNSTTSSLPPENYTTTTLIGNFSTTTTTAESGETTNPTTLIFSTTTITNERTTTTPKGAKKSFFSFWPLILAGVVGLGVLVITVLALSTISIVRSGKRAIRPQKTSSSPPPPYPYNQNLNSELPPAPVSAMSAPQPFLVNTPMNIPLYTMP